MFKRYSSDDWEVYGPALRSLSSNTTETAYRVLVEGEKVADVARERGVSNQTAHTAVKRVSVILDNLSDNGMIPLIVLVPPDKEQEVKKAVDEAGGQIDRYQDKRTTRHGKGKNEHE